MNDQNAVKGIKKLYLGEVLVIAAVIAEIASLLYLAINNVDANMTGIREKLQDSGLLLPFLVFAIGCLFLFLAGYLLTLAGLINGAHDEGRFKRALWVELAVIALTIVTYSIQDTNPQIVRWLNIVSTAAQLFVTLLVVSGINKIAGGLGKQDVTALCERTQRWVIRTFAMSALFEIVLALFFQTDAVMALVFGLVILVLDIISYVLYLQLLAKARVMQ